MTLVEMPESRAKRTAPPVTRLNMSAMLAVRDAARRQSIGVYFQKLYGLVTSCAWWKYAIADRVIKQRIAIDRYIGGTSMVLRCTRGGQPTEPMLSATELGASAP
jgi:hypothetical protein